MSERLRLLVSLDAELARLEFELVDTNNYWCDVIIRTLEMCETVFTEQLPVVRQL